MIWFVRMKLKLTGAAASAVLRTATVIVMFVCLVQPSFAQVVHPSGDKGKIDVDAVEVGRDGKRALTGLGSVHCSKSVDLGFDISGVISEISAREGDRVDAGAILAKLDQTRLKAEVEVQRARMRAAEAELRFRKAELAKMQELFQKQAISDTELKRAVFETEKAAAAIDLAAREIEAAEAKRTQMTLRAPYGGIISKVMLEKGEVVNYSSYHVMRLISCEEADAEIELAEKAYTSVARGAGVSITVDALPGKKFSGRVYSVSPEINQKNRTFTVRVRIANPDLALRPGMFVRAELDVSRVAAGPIWVPASAVMRAGRGSDSVLIVKDGVAVRREVRTGRRAGNRVQVLSGLDNGEVVIVEGLKRVSDLSEVSVNLRGRRVR